MNTFVKNIPCKVCLNCTCEEVDNKFTLAHQQEEATKRIANEIQQDATRALHRVQPDWPGLHGPVIEALCEAVAMQFVRQGCVR